MSEVNFFAFGGNSQILYIKNIRYDKRYYINYDSKNCKKVT